MPRSDSPATQETPGPYGQEFYRSRHDETLHAAEEVLSIVLRSVRDVTSAIDLGCGTGTWLAVLKQKGVSEICGVEGSWVNRNFLQIDESEFVEHDLSSDTPFRCKRRFDLALSLEVAEHLPASVSSDFVSTLTGLSDFVLFSAAIPFQGGEHHVNEQWPTFWISQFEDRGFRCLDFIRKQIWRDQSIPFWYRQNTLMFVRNDRVPELVLSGTAADHVPAEKYLLSFERATVAPGIRQSAAALTRAITRRIRKTF